MKTIKILTLACAVVLLTTACSNDDPTPPTTEQITVVNNDLIFGSAASTATVAVQAATTISATSDAAWATVGVDGQTITVSVSDNMSYEGRTAVLTIKAGEAMRRLPIQQLGMVLGALPVSSHHAPTAGETFTYRIPHDQPMTVASPQQWIHPTMAGNTLSVIVDDNTGGGLRRGIVTTECVGRRDTLIISQYDIANDIAGSYYITGQYGRGGQELAMRFDIVLRNDSLFSNWPNMADWKSTYVPLTFDEGAADLYLPSGFKLFTASTGNDTGYFYDTNDVLAQSTTYTAKLHLEYNATTRLTRAKLETGFWPGHTMAGLLFYTTRGGGLANQVLGNFFAPSFTRIGPVGTTFEEWEQQGN